MELIPNGTNKFQCLGLVEENDNAAKIKATSQKYLLLLQKDDQLARSENKRIRPQGSQRPRMHGFPKGQKPSVPLRPILSMIGSSQHELAKWLSAPLQFVLGRYSSRSIKNCFTFAETIQKLATKPNAAFVCSFDIASFLPTFR